MGKIEQSKIAFFIDIFLCLLSTWGENLMRDYITKQKKMINSSHFLSTQLLSSYFLCRKQIE